MKKNKRKIISIVLIATSIISIGLNTYSHSGRTDSSGGHKDNKNKSGLGSYHYHCGGNPPHLHTNGVCPYSSKKSTTSSSSSSKSSSSNNSKSTSSSTSTETTTTTTSTTTKPSSIEATSIQINENIESMEVGENKKITATIIPENATDKNITWKTSDESIATISATGEITAKKSGIIEITACTTNGRTNSIKINIKEKVENTTIEKSSTISNTANNIVNDTTNSNSQDSNPIGGILSLGLLGGGGYFGYNKYKKSKK